jgi:hypothetical protein
MKSYCQCISVVLSCFHDSGGHDNMMTSPWHAGRVDTGIMKEKNIVKLYENTLTLPLWHEFGSYPYHDALMSLT